MEIINIQKGQKICLRCGNFFKSNQTLKKHLNKQVPCKIRYLDLERNEVRDDYLSYLLFFIKDFNNKNILKQIERLDNQCEYCFSAFNSLSSNYRHKKHYCKSPHNPQNMTSTRINITN